RGREPDDGAEPRGPALHGREAEVERQHARLVFGMELARKNPQRDARHAAERHPVLLDVEEPRDRRERHHGRRHRRRRRVAERVMVLGAQLRLGGDGRSVVEVLGAHAHLVGRIKQVADGERRHEGDGADGGEATLRLRLAVLAEEVVTAPQQIMRGRANASRKITRLLYNVEWRSRYSRAAPRRRYSTERSGWRRKAGMSSSVSSAPDSAAERRGSTFCCAARSARVCSCPSARTGAVTGVWSGRTWCSRIACCAFISTCCGS